MTEGPGGLRPVSADLDEALRRLGMPPDLDAGALVTEWEDIVGEPFASLSRPGGYAAGELTLVAEDGTAATLLKYRLGELVERLEARFGPGLVTSVRVRVKGWKTRP